MSTARAEKAISEMADIADVTAMAAITREFMANKVAKAFAAMAGGQLCPNHDPFLFSKRNGERREKEPDQEHLAAPVQVMFGSRGNSGLSIPTHI